MKYIVGNWKSHKTLQEAQSWIEAYLKKQFLPPADTEIILAPPSPYLVPLAEKLASPAAPTLGAQNVSPFPAGAYTGEVSAQQLQALGVKYVIVGHSERRRYFHETSAEVANKVAQSLTAGIRPIVCVDKPYAQEQIAALESGTVEKCIFAYEPLAAIGTGENADPALVKAEVEFLRELLGNAPIMYGGSVDAINVKAYLEFTDGVLVGTDSLDVEKFLSLLYS